MNKDVAELAKLIIALGEAIEELGSVPSGHLYAQLMGSMSLTTYENMIDVLVRSGRIRREGHLLVPTRSRH